VFRPKQFSIYAHTDKPLYKAGDLVRFRAFALDSETRPFDVDNAEVSIYDSEGLKIKTFSKVPLEDGVFESSFQLSDNPKLGQWKIRIDAEGEYAEKYFNVKEYVLPQYTVRVDVPEKVASIDQFFPVKVTAEYTFGESVQGVAVVSFYKTVYSKWNDFDDYGGGGPRRRPPIWGPPKRVLIFQKQVNIDSASEIFDVDLLKDLKVEPQTSENLEIEVVFTEELTRKSVSATSYLSIVPFAYELVLTSLSGDNYFAPNSIFKYQIAMRRNDGTSAPAGTKVQINANLGVYQTCTTNKLGYWGCSSPVAPQNIVEEYKLDASGKALAQIETKNFDYLSVSATSEISQPGSLWASRPQEQAAGLLDVKILTKT
jgi:hypothetical protein